MTGDRRYAKAVANCTAALTKSRKPGELVANFFDTTTGTSVGKGDTSLGPYGDSFYEYLLKMWIYRGGSRSYDPDPAGRRDYDNTIQTIRQKLYHRAGAKSEAGTRGPGLYIADWKGGKVIHKMWHLTCFVGGLFALSSYTAASTLSAAIYAADAADITHTCRDSYASSRTRLGPETLNFGGPTTLQGSKYVCA